MNFIFIEINGVCIVNKELIWIFEWIIWNECRRLVRNKNEKLDEYGILNEVYYNKIDD